MKNFQNLSSVFGFFNPKAAPSVLTGPVKQSLPVIISDDPVVIGNTKIAAMMGIVYKCTSEALNYHHRQRMNADGTPYNPPGRLIESEWLLWNPNKNYNDLMAVVLYITSLGYRFSFSSIHRPDGLVYTCRITYRHVHAPKKQVKIAKFDETPSEAMYRAVVDFAAIHAEKLQAQ